MMMMKVKLTGTKALLMHNERLANPLDETTQELKGLTAKKKKTDADHKAIAEVEFRGSMYFDETIGPFIPDRNIRAALIEAARKSKLGLVVAENVWVTEAMMPLDYKGPRTVAGLWREKRHVDQRMVGNQKVRILRTRPRFDEWALTATVTFDEEAIDQRTMESVFKRAQTLGLCDYRPLFGTFECAFLSCSAIGGPALDTAKPKSKAKETA